MESNKINSFTKKSINIKQYKFDGINIELTDEFNKIIDLLENKNESLFITGRAGTGKSTLLSYFYSTTKKKVILLAPTGLSALNIGGQTIHSFFNFPGKLITENQIKKLRHKKLINKLDTIIIDEVSMVRSDLMDGIDSSLRLNRNSSQPFGGVQMVFIGDLFQLSPIVKGNELLEYFQTHYSSPYFFSANVFSEIKFKMVELTKVFRQTDKGFVKFLDAVRKNNLPDNWIKRFNERISENNVYNIDEYVILSTTNKKVDNINKNNLIKITDEEFTYEAEINGEFSFRELPAEKTLTLKVGAKVMMIRNDPEKRWVNGSFGIISKLNEDEIYVTINNIEYEVYRDSWENIRYTFDKVKNEIKEEIIGIFVQFPIKLAWALTIHKSQGQTLKNVLIDFHSGTFTAGQAYVALSRCTSFDGIIMQKPLLKEDIIIDKRLLQIEEVLEKIDLIDG